VREKVKARKRTKGEGAGILEQRRQKERLQKAREEEVEEDEN
jgi:hypothetical protein